MAAATTDIAPTEINPHLVFNPQKNKFKWNSDLKTFRDFWIAELEGGDENNLVSVNSNGNIAWISSDYFESLLLPQ